MVEVLLFVGVIVLGITAAIAIAVATVLDRMAPWCPSCNRHHGVGRCRAGA